MSKKLGIIVTNIEMKKTIEDLYPKEIQSGNFMIEILDRDNMKEPGRRLEAKGARVIIGRSGTYDRSIGNVSVPLLRLKVTSLDIFSALIKGLKFEKKMVLVLWEGIYLDKSLLKFIPVDVEIKTFKDGEKIEAVYKEIIKTNSEIVIVGGGVVSSYARSDGFPFVFINASVESIVETIDYAKELMDSLNSMDFQHELLTKTLDNVRDAVVVMDENGEVQVFNKRAEDILRIGMGRVIGKILYEVLPKFKFLEKDFASEKEKKEELLWIGSLVISYSTSLMWGNHKVKGMLLTFQDTTRLQMLEQKIRRMLNKKGLVAKYNFSDIIYEDESMDLMIKKAKKIGQSDSSAVIYGESGTGKEILAQSLHNVSYRNKAPFVAINCAALSESLLESELFGYEEGAFTGARKGGKPGLFELAHGGTIFLDEINSISLSLQGKLLRVIEEKEVMRLGSDYLIPLNVRIISASNEDLKSLVKKKVFRGDLFYRLSSLEIYIPPLRERRGDIEPLFMHFLKELDKDENIRWPKKEEIDKLTKYDWPGNVRELRNMAERYILFDEIELLQSEDVAMFKENEDSLDLKEIQKIVEDRIISQLMKSGLSKNEIAEKLGVSRGTLWNKSKK
jgi:propionate catabolism operon transcriptional regulator